MINITKDRRRTINDTITHIPPYTIYRIITSGRQENATGGLHKRPAFKTNGSGIVGCIVVNTWSKVCTIRMRIAIGK